MTHPETRHPLELSEWRWSEPVAGDASLRRYSRLAKPDGRTAILVEYPESIRHRLITDLDVFSWCRRLGLRVPGLMASDTDRGLALLEDLGRADAEAVFMTTPPDRRPALLERLLEPLEVLARCRPDELPPWNPPLDRSRMRWELAGFELWYLRHYRSRPPTPLVSTWLDTLADTIAVHPRRVCHRDYHLNNLLIQDDGSVAVIDVQDILVGPDTYDVVSLVAERAAARMMVPAERHRVLAAWADRTSAQPGWRERAAAVRIQRGLKVLGTFARFTVAGRTDYHRWLTELAEDLAALIASTDAPTAVTAFLLD